MPKTLPPLQTDDDDQEVEIPRDRWRFRPRRLLFGFGLIALGVVWSFFNVAPGPGHGAVAPAPAVHGPAATRDQTLSGLRARPVLPPGSGVASPVQVDISFHNDGAVARAIRPSDLRLAVAGHTLSPAARGPHRLGVTTLRPGAYVSGVLDFSRAPAPGATLIYAPPWAHGHSLRWVLWR